MPGEQSGPRGQSVLIEKSRAGRDIIVNLYDAVQAPLRSYVRRDQFLALIDDKIRDFIDRPEMEVEISRHLRDPDFRSGYIMVAGDPGIGKTAFAARLVVANSWLHHFNIRASRISTSEAFLGNVCAQLIARYELDISEISHRQLEDAGFLMELLDLAVRKSGRPIVIVVDALDEADPETAGVNRLLLPRIVPDGIFFIVTSRVPHGLNVEWHREVPLAADSPENLNCLYQFADHYARQHAQKIAEIASSLGETTEALVAQLLHRSRGNFRYLRLTLDHLRATNGPGNGTSGFPPALALHYNQYWSAMRSPSESSYQEEQYPILSCLVGAERPLTVGEIVQQTGLDQPRVRQVLRDWRTYLRVTQDSGEKHHALFHDDFAEYLRQEEELPRHGVAPRQRKLILIVDDTSAEIIAEKITAYDVKTITSRGEWAEFHASGGLRAVHGALVDLHLDPALLDATGLDVLRVLREETNIPTALMSINPPMTVNQDFLDEQRLVTSFFKGRDGASHLDEMVRVALPQLVGDDEDDQLDRLRVFVRSAYFLQARHMMKPGRRQNLQELRTLHQRYEETIEAIDSRNLSRARDSARLFLDDYVAAGQNRALP